ncbi:pectinacetylesterase domain protein [Leptospira fainei serovar Hurstbridge str. BUT 6]|uniref:Pectinacetylesterase domain protein n=1 Tax=Leptospira fainei serovar Hurstbridge str. BUT 6 TaxID=1193011 RepID=S3W471_9LEPT|nr:pectin acetylesterase-family hydrolase [Leptospira fainei]EPG75077.1 pectinacetylesterase domain protein [Leptospira fainei serovar Hurstbridge str. BUT 6]
MKIDRIIIGALAIFITAASCKTKNDNNKEIVELALAVALYNPYEKITPTSGTITITGASYTNRAYSPSCTGVTGNTTFDFFRKKIVDNNTKLLINFMGGGACWDGSNCFGNNTTTYFNQLNAVPDLFVKFAFRGIMNETAPANPFKNYDVVFIPYCTGDLHIGHANTVYVNPLTGTNVTISHYGYDNVLSVLKYIQQNYTNVQTVFVTGQSAGGYGAILNYPVVRETIKGINAGAQVSMLSDASNGIVPASGTPGAFFPKLASKWGVEAAQNLPTWVTGIAADYTSNAANNASMNDFFTKVAAFYSGDRLAQYAAIFDSNQRFFYNVMGQINRINGVGAALTYSDSATSDPYDFGRTYSTIFGDSDGTSLSDGTSTSSADFTTCDWSKQAISKMKAVAAARTNYRYYLGPGDVHTITTSDTMFTLSSGGNDFTTWLTNFATGSIPGNVECSDNSGSCVSTNLVNNTVNRNLGQATSDQSYAASRSLYTACGGFAGLGL